MTGGLRWQFQLEQRCSDYEVAARILFDWPALAAATAGCLAMACATSLLTAASALRVPAVQAAGVTE